MLLLIELIYVGISKVSFEIGGIIRVTFCVCDCACACCGCGCDCVCVCAFYAPCAFCVWIYGGCGVCCRVGADSSLQWWALLFLLIRLNLIGSNMSCIDWFQCCF